MAVDRITEPKIIFYEFLNYNLEYNTEVMFAFLYYCYDFDNYTINGESILTHPHLTNTYKFDFLPFSTTSCLIPRQVISLNK